jgi:hypothetical protein
MSAEYTRRAFVTKLEGLTTKPTVRRYENDNSKPTVGTVWSQFSFLPNPPTPVTLGATGQDELTGVVQYSLYAPLGQGEAPLLTHLRAVLAAIPAGTVLTYSGRSTQVVSCGRGPGMVSQDQQWWMVPVTISFRSRYPRSTPAPTP